MKSGELRQGESLHFDGVGYYTKPTVDHFKVNKYMLKKGFVWEHSALNTPGVWVDIEGDSDPLSQDEAVEFYKNRKRFWQIFKK